MADHLMVVLSNAKPGLEDEFNDWYTNVHIVEIVDKLDGVEAAQRFALSGVHRDVEAPFKYLSLYWIPEDKLDDAKAAFKWQAEERAQAYEAGREPFIDRRDVFEEQPRGWFFSKICERYTNPASGVIVAE